MSVVSHQARRRWAVVAAGVAVLICLPAAASATTSLLSDLTSNDATVGSAAELVARALASASVPYSGLAQSTGTLGLPDLPQFGDVAATLGGTTRTRVWWSGTESWRVAVLSSTGERDIYHDDGRSVLWDYEAARLTEITGTSSVRLPRADDLMPPQAARRLLAGLGPADRLTVLPGRRLVAGVRAVGVRIVPADRRSTIGQVDLWLEPVHALPVAISVLDVAGVTSLRSQFTALSLTGPDPSLVRVPSAPGAEHDSTDQPDLAARLQQFENAQLPDQLAGVASSAPIVGGTATYGSGLIRFVVVPLPGRLAAQTLAAAQSSGSDLALNGGDAVLVSSGLINLVVARPAGQRGGYLLAGLVRSELLSSAAEQLLHDPPAERFR